MTQTSDIDIRKCRGYKWAEIRCMIRAECSQLDASSLKHPLEAIYEYEDRKSDDVA